MRVLSLFDGISCARVALGDSCTTYYASEIDPKAIEVAKKNYPDTIHVGSVVDLKGEDFKDIDLLIGGSPCTDLSIAKKGRQGLEGSHSKLFWEYLRLLREIKPKWFVLENVASMSKKDKGVITKELGVEPVLINAALVSAQSRKRLFWTNIPVKGLPEDRGILLKHIIHPDSEIDERMVTEGKSYCLTANYGKATEKNSVEFKQRTMVRETAPSTEKVMTEIDKKPHEFHQVGFFGAETSTKVGGQALRVYSDEAKSPTLSTSGIGLVRLTKRVGHVNNSTSQFNRVYSSEYKSPTIHTCGGIFVEVPPATIRKLTPVECERLQSLPDNYTEGVAKTHRYRCLGNAFNVEVIKFILSFIE